VYGIFQARTERAENTRARNGCEGQRKQR